MGCLYSCFRGPQPTGQTTAPVQQPVQPSVQPSVQVPIPKKNAITGFDENLNEPTRPPARYFFQEGPGTIRYVLLKQPGGDKFLFYRPFEKGFVLCENINLFLKTIYQSSNFRKGKSWTDWLIYNDEVEGSTHTTAGHCKGILAWNKDRISWLVHSVPKFPATFDGDCISPIQENQLIYGQSFHYIEFAFNADTLLQIRRQLDIMHANIYLLGGETTKETTTIPPPSENIRIIPLTQDIHHVAKSPNYEIDIYSDYLVKNYGFVWSVESWIRGHRMPVTPTNARELVLDIETWGLGGESATEIFHESQDHSKWAVSNTEDYYWVGDLNRMTSQKHRGGGGILGKDADLKKALGSLIVRTTVDITLKLQ